MADMPSRPLSPDDAAHEAEVQQQLAIAADAAPAETAADVPPEVLAPTAETVTIKSVNVDEYPVNVDVVGAPEGGYSFADANTTFEVPLDVAEQFTYVSVVEVVA